MSASKNHSTGPRTPEGKAISSRNAIKDGLSARGIFVRDETESCEFQALRTGLLQDIRPESPLEYSLFDMLVHAAWNLKRVNKLQAGLESACVDPLLDDSLDKQFARLARFHTQHQRTYFRCLRELERMQTNRVLRDRMVPQKEAQLLPVLVPVQQIAKRTERPVRVDECMCRIDAGEAGSAALAGQTERRCATPRQLVLRNWRNSPEFSIKIAPFRPIEAL